ncbi:MAG: transcriptional regulator [Ramlibacter sp.]|nr:transcriptional regulator [Ramlibacter sp.]
MINPILGMKDSHASTNPADALFPRVRQRVLALLYAHPHRSFFSNEIVALAQSGTGAVQRELVSLASAGLLNVSIRGNQKHYQANMASPVFEELRGIVLKTSGLVDVLRVALAPVTDRIHAAFVYGSIARRQDSPSSDVDLMVIADSVGYGKLFAALEEAGDTLRRKVNPTLYTRQELAKRLQKSNAFTTRVLSQDKLWVLGSEESLNGITA